MKKWLIILLFFTLCVGIASAQEPTCVRFKACVDGSDFITVNNGQLSMDHRNYDPIGTPEDCNEAWGLNDLIQVNGIDHPISLINNPYTIDNNNYLSIGITSLASFNIIDQRGPVTWANQANHVILINDDESGGGAIYTIDLCGEPSTVPPINTPEFPSAVLPVTMIIGFLGAVLYIQRTREQ